MKMFQLYDLPALTSSGRPLLVRRGIAATLRAFILIALSISLTSCQSITSGPIPIEVWRRGDDGATLRLVDALQGATKQSSRFTLVSGGSQKLETLIVIVPKVDVRSVAGRQRIYYSVTFTSLHNPTIDSSVGSCWEEDLSQCAAQILKDARIISAKIR
jgi:hypothetical protein